MRLTMRRLRLKTVWLIVLPFMWFAVPTPRLIGIGACLAVIGLWIRGWSAGTIHKDQEVTTTGPYAFTRNPLYLGSAFIGFGVSLAGGHWVWPLLFLTFYAVVYSRTMRGEVSHLTELFPDTYGEYAANVPFFFPRLSGGVGRIRIRLGVVFDGPSIVATRSGRHRWACWLRFSSLEQRPSSVSRRPFGTKQSQRLTYRSIARLTLSRTSRTPTRLIPSR
ncbi:MAG: methyltransferase family protein [Longimicrobiales bacterium]